MAAKNDIHADAEHPRDESVQGRYPNRFGGLEGTVLGPASAKALRAQAVSSDDTQRRATVFGQVPLAGAGPGWYVTQTLTDHDEGAFQVTAPDGACAGYVSRSYRGAKSWTAYPGDPADRNYKIRCIFPAEGDPAAKNGEWPTPEDAGLAIARDYTQSGLPGVPGNRK